MSKTCFYFSGNPFQYGGGATVAINLLEEIASSNVRPVLMVSQYAGIPKVIEGGFDVRRVYMPKNRILLELFDQIVAPFLLIFFMPKRVVCLNSILPILYPFRIDLFFQMRMFYFEELDSFSKKIKNKLGVLSVARANNVYCASKDHANDMVTRLNVKASKVKVIHLGFSSKNPKKVSVRNDALVFVSVIRPYKNLHGLIDAVLSAKEKRPDLPICLNVIGEPANYLGIDDYMNSIHDAVSSSNYGSCINFLGKKTHDEVLSYLAESKCMVFPTLFEGFGLPLLEAMATSTPVLSSSVNSLPEISNGTTLFVDTEDVDAFSDKIIGLYVDDYPSSLLHLAKARADRFCWKNASEALMNNTDFIVD